MKTARTHTTKLSIIIISFNTRRLLDQCIQSLYHSRLAMPFEIIVVDNASCDGSVAMCAAKYPEVTVLRNDANNLFAKANNQGADVACGEYLLLLNSDTIMEAGGIEPLVAFMDSAPDRIACVGPTVFNEDQSIQSRGYALSSIRERITMCFALHRIMPKCVGRWVLPAGTPGLRDSESHLVGWISGSCMLLRRDVYHAVGGLNAELGFYGEEPELGARLRAHGYETWLVPEAKIVHLGGKSAKTSEGQYLQEESRRLHCYAQLQKHTVGYRKAIWMSRIVILASLMKMLLCARHRAHFRQAVNYEKRVVRYLKACQKQCP